jgi:hypothetical protein
LKLLFLTWAGGGNSTPVLGLATRLLARGHDVRVVSPGGERERFAAVGVALGILGSGRHPALDEIARTRPDVVVDFMMPAWLCEAEASGVTPVALVHTIYDRLALLTTFTTLDAINEHRDSLALDPPRTRRDSSTGSRACSSPRHARSTAPRMCRRTLATWARYSRNADPTTAGYEPIIARVLDAVRELPVVALVNAGSRVVTPSSMSV